MVTRRSLALVLAMVLIGSCQPARGRQGVRPAPPGPVDAIRSLWGDYSSRCPRDYDYCSAGHRSICCPYERGCCEDANGAYCCSSRADGDWAPRGRDDRRRSSDLCSSDEITCSHGGRTICCSSNDGCCAGAEGPYCCAAYESHDTDRGY